MNVVSAVVVNGGFRFVLSLQKPHRIRQVDFSLPSSDPIHAKQTMMSLSCIRENNSFSEQRVANSLLS